MLTKEEFLAQVEEASLKRNRTANLFHAGDPRIYQMQESTATMLAMLSQQVEVALAEPFVKSRDATVLADASAKGVLFTGKSSLINIKAENKGKKDISVGAGRKLLDTKGRPYLATKTITIPVGETVTIQAIQNETETQTRTITESKPFLGVEVEQPEDNDNFIESLRVYVNDKEFEPTTNYCSIAVDEPIYNVESDEFQKLYVRFGMDGILGSQPQTGDIVKIERTITYGEISLEQDSPISFDYINNIEDADLSMTFVSIQTQGRNPASLDVLRQLINYPSIYDENAVYLGEFERLVKLKFPNLSFSAVWNEQREEEARGASMDSVNALFFSFVQEENAVMTKEAQKEAIIKVLKNADSSYKYKFVEPVESAINVTVECYISASYDAGVTKNEIRELLLKSYSKENIHKVTATSVKNRNISDLLTKNVTALGDSRADIDVNVDRSSTQTSNPEDFVYMTEASISISVDNIDYQSNIWAG